MRFVLAVFVLVIASVLPARADLPEVDYASRVVACVAAAGEDAAAIRACRGAAWTPCAEVPGAETTYGTVMCYGFEAEGWSNIMAATLTRLETSRPEFAESLNRAQTQWLAYRDAECSYRVERWGLGSGGRVELAGCFADLTAERAISLVLYARYAD